MQRIGFGGAGTSKSLMWVSSSVFGAKAKSIAFVTSFLCKGRPPRTSMDYLRWNDAIAAHFFDPTREGWRVWLDVTEEVIGGIGKEWNLGVPDFVAAVKRGPAWAESNGFCQRALESCAGWRARHLKFPPYIGYLGLFVLAAGIEAEV